MKFFLTIFLTFVFLFGFSTNAFAQENFISVVNPVRGSDFFPVNLNLMDGLRGEMEILKKENVPATWLIRYDALGNNEVVSELKKNSPNHELGLFLEVTPSWTRAASVDYHKSADWHFAGSVFLTGYSTSDREKLIDRAFDEFNLKFGYSPKSVGAWWIDGISLEYMQKKYGITGAMIVADQYSTDNYQIWGQYFSTPYYPDKTKVINPAQSKDEKLPVVISQWAVRDPVNGYGKGVEESTYSVQANDYIDFHNLGISYFGGLVDTYMNQRFNQFNFLVVGLENSYDWSKYKAEYERQIKLLNERKKSGKLSLVTQGGFSSYYLNKYPELSPSQIIISDDPLGSDRKTVWFMSPYYRALLSLNHEGNAFRDIRQYVDGETELCYKDSCENLNFATSAVRVLDYVTFGHEWLVDDGKIKDLEVLKDDEKYIVTYINEGGKFRKVEFLPRDIAVDGKISSIDQAILDAQSKGIVNKKGSANLEGGIYKIKVLSFLISSIKFLLFIILVIFIPGFIFYKRLFNGGSYVEKLFVSFGIGIASFSLIHYLTNLLNFYWGVYLYLIINIFLLVYLKILNTKWFVSISRAGVVLGVIILAGTFFQILPVYKSGLLFNYGVGFWGPNSHDGVWHLSLINELTKGIPPQNPIFAGENLVNYHYQYDLLIAATNNLTMIDGVDLLFRFYPALLSVLLGLGTIVLTRRLFKSDLASIFSLYFVYFSGSFGWIVEYIKQKHFGGESAFWANQAISFNLNPPFAASLILVILLFVLLDRFYLGKNKFLGIYIILITGIMLQFKAYAAIIMITAMSLMGLKLLFRKDPRLIFLAFGSGIVSLLLLLPNYQLVNLLKSSGIFVFSPFWLVHTMIDFTDRVGWVRLAMARDAGYQTGNWFKFVAAEALGLFIFLGGNLGGRIVSLVEFFRTEKVFLHQLIVVFSIIAVVIPLLFIQKGTPWNTIQFFYYFLFTSAVFAGGSLVWLKNKLPPPLFYTIILGLFLITPINSIVTAKGYLYPSPHTFVSVNELGALNFLSAQPDGVVLTMPYDKGARNRLSEPWPIFSYDTTSYVSAYSKKRVFVEDEIQQDILQTDYTKRIVATKNFIQLINSLDENSTGEEIEKFLGENKIKYIYIPKFYNFSLPEGKFGINKIFENNEVLIYKFGN